MAAHLMIIEIREEARGDLHVGYRFVLGPSVGPGDAVHRVG
jgi:hypothetical protein